MEQINFNDISYFIGVVLSVASEQIPQVKSILDQYTPKQRFFGQLVVVLVVVLSINLLSCRGIAVYECLSWDVLVNAIASWGIGQVFYWVQKDFVS